MKRDILMMGILTVFGCWGVHIGKINREISKFDRELKVMKQAQNSSHQKKNMIQ